MSANELGAAHIGLQRFRYADRSIRLLIVLHEGDHDSR